MAEQKLPDKAQETEMKREKVRVVPIKYIDDSPDHPFQVRDDEEMMSMGGTTSPLRTSTVGLKRPKSISFLRSTQRMWSKSCFSIRV